MVAGGSQGILLPSAQYLVSIFRLENPLLSRFLWVSNRPFMSLGLYHSIGLMKHSERLFYDL